MSESILEIPEVRQRVSRLSLDEYCRLDELNENGRRTELIRGIVIEKMAKTPLRRLVCSCLYRILLDQLPEDYAVWKEEPLTLKDSEPEPDVSVTRGTESSFATRHPSTAELVVEVAVSNQALDRVNARLYAEAGVQEYWIVLAREKQVEVFSLPENGTYANRSVVGPQATLSCTPLPSVRVDLTELFA